jgi:hypothetical protein
VFVTGPRYREYKSKNWEHNFKILMDVTYAQNNVRGLVGADNDIFVMKERQVFSNIWVFKD